MILQNLINNPFDNAKYFFARNASCHLFFLINDNYLATTNIF